MSILINFEAVLVKFDPKNPEAHYVKLRLIMCNTFLK